VIPSAVVILLMVRVVRQENELSERQAAEAQRKRSINCAANYRLACRPFGWPRSTG
jgi:hypothetical protein